MKVYQALRDHAHMTQLTSLAEPLHFNTLVRASGRLLAGSLAQNPAGLNDLDVSSKRDVDSQSIDKATANYVSRWC